MYCLFVNLICACQFVCVTKLCKHLLENEADQNRISLLVVGFITVYDSYLCLQNLYFALLNYVLNPLPIFIFFKQYFQYFIIPAFFYFLLSTTCDMKLIWILWRARYIAEINDNEQLRRAIAIFFVQFCKNLQYLFYFFQILA